MKSLRGKLLSGTFIPFVAGAGVAMGSAIAEPSSAHAVMAAKSSAASLPAAKPRPGQSRLAACNPCAAKNPCNPCAAAKPCSACGAADSVEITGEEAEAVDTRLRRDMAAASAKAGLAYVKDYQSWTNFALVPYQSTTHGGRYVNNYTNAVGEPRYTLFEEVGAMPSGSVIAKDSFVVNASGTTAIGPLFIMEKMPGGFDAGTHDWRYTMVMSNGTVFGTTGGDGSASVGFCAECHAAVAEGADSLFFLPGEFRAKF